VQTYKSPKEVESSTAAVGRNIPKSARPGLSRPDTGRHRRPPWKGSDKTPQDTWRHNYLDNDDEIEKVNKLLVYLHEMGAFIVPFNSTFKLIFPRATLF